MSELSTEYCECAVVEHYTSSVESVELITTRDSAESELSTEQWSSTRDRAESELIQSFTLSSGALPGTVLSQS